ncbi:MAG TPA: amidase [Anaerolineae bacterium]
MSFPTMTIAEIQRGLAAGTLTAAGLVEHYLRRISEIDGAGPALHAVIETNPDAPALAQALDAERRSGRVRGPLHGIPVLLKDNIDTGDRMLTTAGSLALVGAPAPRDASLVTRLRAAGVVLLGKTNLSEWANFRSEHSVSGWSSRGGQTRNPYALDRNPCGSSSGSAVAVSADLCAAAVGTETDGSIICPSHANGIVGLKPTLGLISRAGIVPIAHSQDTAGPMGRTVADVAALLGALVSSEPDPRDPPAPAAAGRASPDYTRFLTTGSLAGTRIGIARNFFGFDGRVDRIMDECIKALGGLGADVVDPAPVATPPALDESEMEVLLYDFKTDLDAYLAGRGAAVAVHSLTDVIAFNERHRPQMMPYFEQELLVKAAEKGPLTEDAYRQALATCRRLAQAEGIDATLAEHRLDAIAAPSGGPAWLIDYVSGDYGSGGSSSPAAVAGYPNVTVPAGYVYGLPVGISFFAGAFAEPTLVKFAFAFEQATRVRKPPQFLKTVQF